MPAPISALAPDASAEEVVRTFMGDLAPGLAKTLLADDFVLEVTGEGNWSIGGEYQGDRLRELMSLVNHRFPKGVPLTIRELTAAGERVIVEATSDAMRRDGRRYQNSYVFIFIVRDGQIRRQREFCDIILADEFLCGPMSDEVSEQA
jgi:ketosteroid isomerase-like protein